MTPHQTYSEAVKELRERKTELAEQLFREACARLSIPVTRLTVIIDELDDDLKPSLACIGHTHPHGYELQIDPSMPEEEYPGTVAHEVAHIVLEHFKDAQTKAIHGLFRTIEDTLNAAEEATADRIALLLDLPKAESYGKKETSQ